MKFDALKYPYSSRRNVTYAANGMVATTHPLASQAGLDMLKKGGNAIDAAIATAACLAVVEPTSNGIGGDAFAIVWKDNQLYGLNSSGQAPNELSIEKLKDKGFKEMPMRGWETVTVPGAPAAWASLSERFGKLPFEELLQPAIQYAEEGFPVLPTVGQNWKAAYEEFKELLTDSKFTNWFNTFAPDGRSPKVGEIWRSHFHADTLTRIAESKAKDFYTGTLADKIHDFSLKTGGYIRKSDLEAFAPEWVTPISINYRGYDIWELPPNGQGLVALLGLSILSEFKFTEKEATETYHKQIEALKLAFTDGKKYITDPREMVVSLETLLGPDYAKERSAMIGHEALDPNAQPVESGTVYLAAADNEGNMVSFIQSNFNDFGSGLVVPGTGINLQNRGRNFSLDPGHINHLKPGKKTYHTIIPGFITKEDRAVGAFGVMGGYMQPQGHLQVLSNLIDFDMNPQAALDAPRWFWSGNKEIHLESQVGQHIAQELSRRGHSVNISLDQKKYGRGQIVLKDPDSGILIGGTEGRADGSISAW